jgi:hypothetical protein
MVGLSFETSLLVKAPKSWNIRRRSAQPEDQCRAHFPEIKSQLAELGATPITVSPDKFGTFVTSEAEKWEKVIKFSGVKVE